MDPRLTLASVTESAEDALESTRTHNPEFVILDHGLAGALTGLDAAPQLKAVVPHAKIVLFTAHTELKVAVDQEPAIDAFLLETDSTQLLALAQRLTGLSGPLT
jgi:DNA-binding NarL/FixJ family response regulator